MQGESALYGLLPVVEDLPRQSGSACHGENGRYIHTYIHTYINTHTYMNTLDLDCS